MPWPKPCRPARSRSSPRVEGGAAIGSFGIVDVTPETARDGFVDGTPETLLPAVFAMAEGDVQVIEAGLRRGRPA